MGDWNYTRDELELARTSMSTAILHRLAQHESRFVRAQIAGNCHTDLPLRLLLRFDRSRGVIYWLINNKSLSKVEYDDLLERIMTQGIDDMLCSALAGSCHASIAQLLRLQSYHQWGIDIAILNNYKDRDTRAYRALIARYLPGEDVPFEQWTEIEQLAYLRTYGIRRPNPS